jgi:hypothetical protein
MTARQQERAAARAIATAYPAPWLFVNDHIELELGGTSRRDVRLMVDTTTVARLAAADLAVRLENTRWLAARNASSWVIVWRATL